MAVSDGSRAAWVPLRALGGARSGSTVVDIRIERHADAMLAYVGGAPVEALPVPDVPELRGRGADGFIAIGHFGDCALGPLHRTGHPPIPEPFDPMEYREVLRDPVGATRRVRSTWTAVDVELWGVGAHVPLEWPSGVDGAQLRERFAAGLPAPLAERARALAITDGNARCVAPAIVDAVVHRVVPDLARTDTGAGPRALRGLARARRIVDTRAALAAYDMVPGPDVPASYEVRRFPCAGLPCGLPWDVERVPTPPASCEPQRCELRYVPASDTSAFLPIVRRLLELRSRWATDAEAVHAAVAAAAELIANDGDARGARVGASVLDELQRAAARPCRGADPRALP